MNDDNIDAVIGLPSNLFYSTGIPVCILVLKKCKKSNDVLFINASEYFDKEKRQNKLGKAHIEKIIATYKNRTTEDRYSRCVSMDEIKTNDYNLNISRYISTSKDEEQIELDKVHADLLSAQDKIKSATEKHNSFLRELGLSLLVC